ncbi:hypothetical protein ACFX2I_011298 [Malus domestica]
MLAQEEPSTTTGNLDPATRRSHRYNLSQADQVNVKHWDGNPLDMDYRIKANNPFGIYFFLRLLCRVRACRLPFMSFPFV